MWGLFRVGLGCIYVMHLGVYLGVRSKKAENNGEAEKSREAEKQRSRETEIQKNIQNGKKK